MHERMKREEPLLLQQQLQIFDLFRGHGNHHPSKADETDQSRSSQNSLPRISGPIDVHERVSWKKRNCYYLPAVAPRVMFGQQRKEDVDRSEEHTSELQSPCNLVC